MREQKDFLEKGAKKLLLYCGAAFLALFLLFFGLKYLLPCTLPFWIALPTAILLYRPAAWLSETLHLPKKLTAGVLVLLFYGILFFLLFVGGRQVLRECGDFLSRFLREKGGFSGILETIQGELSARFPFLRGLLAEDSFSPSLASALENSLQGILERLTAWLPSALASAAGFFPEAVLFLAALLLCSVFLTADYPKSVRGIFSLLPESVRRVLPKIRRRVRELFFGYVKSSCILFAVSFGLLYAGFLFLHMKDPLFLAFLIAMIDLLPILGLGTVLLPWGLFLLLTGDPFRGFGLLILYAAALLIRHLLMPHLLTKSVGLPPLWTVLSLYAGYQCAGILGILTFPLLAVGSVSLYRGWRETRESAPPSGPPSDKERKMT